MRGVQHRMKTGVLLLCVGALILSVGCRSFRAREEAAPPGTSVARPSPQQLKTGRNIQGRVVSLICLFDQKPWFNADASGDRDPEGIQYRVFLNTGGDKSVPRDGTFHIEMYRFGRDEKGAQTRELVSDWHYPTSQFTVVSAALMGIGYHVQLRWARKDIAGSEVEIVTQFEDPEGNITRGATKRLRVPKYTSGPSSERTPKGVAQ